MTEILSDDNKTGVLTGRHGLVSSGGATKVARSFACLRCSLKVDGANALAHMISKRERNFARMRGSAWVIDIKCAGCGRSLMGDEFCPECGTARN